VSGKLKNIISLFLLLVFLTPSIVKLEHHHEHIFHKTTNEKHFNLFHEKCAICSFEFSVFLTIIKRVSLQKENPVDRYCNNYQPVFVSALTSSSLLLRAPPAVRA